MQDLVFQRFILQESERDLLFKKIQVYSALATVGDNNEIRAEILQSWNKIVALTYGGKVEDYKPKHNEQSMMAEYEKIRKLNPKFKISKSKNGKDYPNVVVEGLGSLDPTLNQPKPSPTKGMTLREAQEYANKDSKDLPTWK